MGWTAQEFHDFANVTHALIWQGGVAVTRPRISIADSRRLCARTGELLATRRDDRRFRRRPLNAL